MPAANSIEDLFKKASPSAAAAASTKPGLPAPPPPPAKKSGPANPATLTTSQKLTESMGVIKVREKEKLAAEEAERRGLPYIALRGFPITPEALSLIPKKDSEAKQAIVFLRIGDEIRIGTTNPSDAVNALVTKIAEENHAHVELYFISEDSFQAAFELYAKLPEPKEVIYGYRINEADLAKYSQEISDFRQLQEKIVKVNTTDIITLMMGAALKVDCSDIHVEAEEESVKIRFRLDGRLRDAARLPKATWKQIIGRLKLLAGVKINVEDVPQDGRITIYLTNEKIDIRVSFLPTAFGESVVMRLLRPKAIALEFEQLGIRGKAQEDLIREIDKPNGMIITTGPTGSGKTTTLYAILKKLNSAEEKIITLEDPVEYKLQGINQSQIEHNRNYDFAKGLRAILRQDPDIVMVGEIRDAETADIAIQAALTGHLVVSTIHTNSAAGAIPRFLSMGVKPFLLAPALNAVIGQRLVRRLCQNCKIPLDPSPLQTAEIKATFKAMSPKSGYTIDFNNLHFFGPKGCDVCNGLGYKGRVGIYEIFTMTKEIETIILSKEVSEFMIQDLAVKDGMVTMLQDGLLKALDGLTSVEEVLTTANFDTTVLEPLEEAVAAIPAPEVPEATTPTTP